MGVPPVYTAVEETIASYNWSDIADGVGYVTLYGAKDLDNTGSNYMLVPNAINASGYIPEDTTINLDTSAFNLPQRIGGKAFVTFYLQDDTVDAHYVTIKFIKVSGATTTDISSSTRTVSLTSATIYPFALFIDITETHFKKGDILRLEVQVSAGGGDSQCLLQPAGAYPFILNIPFKISS